jgi:hypothetical protein
MMTQFFFKTQSCPKESFKNQALLFGTPIINEPMLGFHKLFPMNLERVTLSTSDNNIVFGKYIEHESFKKLIHL